MFDGMMGRELEAVPIGKGLRGVSGAENDPELGIVPETGKELFAVGMGAVYPPGVVNSGIEDVELRGPGSGPEGELDGILGYGERS